MQSMKIGAAGGSNVVQTDVWEGKGASELNNKIWCTVIEDVFRKKQFCCILV